MMPSVEIIRYQEKWMRYALWWARAAASAGEVPVGAVLVRDDQLLGAGRNSSIASHDPTAHAEICALRAAGRHVDNYRLPDSCLFVTLEPCLMCAGAIIHARVKTVIYGAADPKAGACGSVFNVLPSDHRFNHHTACIGGCLSEQSRVLLQSFFQQRRAQQRMRLMNS
jgi:tRNA(adenine34) deaminase